MRSRTSGRRLQRRGFPPSLALAREGPPAPARRRPTALLLALGLVLGACTSEPTDRTPRAGPEPSPPVTPEPEFLLPVVVGVGAHPSYLDGMELAAGEVGVALDVRPTANSFTELRHALTEGPPAVLVVGAADAVAEARPEIEGAGVPVILVGGDLYSDRRLFRHAFQTAVPLRWQGRVLARYLVVDRRLSRIAVVGDRDLGAEALAEEGVSPVGSPADAEAVLALGPPHRPPAGVRLAAANQAVLRRGLAPGTVVCLPYTWAGWADMLPRVRRFRARFERAHGRPPSGFEQEGYDAVRAVHDALTRAGGGGGEALLLALEGFREETYSSLPVRLGPDDHVLAEESQLGLFAVTDAPVPTGEAQGAVPWRPLMRTFTTDGQKVNLLDPDKRVFFPGWSRRKPSPRYWKSRFGIVTRPDEDLLH